MFSRLFQKKINLPCETQKHWPRPPIEASQPMAGCGRSAGPTGDAAGTHPARRARARTSPGASLGEAGRSPGPLAALGPGSKVRAVAAIRPPPTPRPGGPDSRPDLRLPRDRDFGRGEPGSLRHLPAVPGLSPGQRGQPRRSGEPTHPHGCCEDPRDLPAQGGPNSLLLAPLPWVPAASG